MKERPKGHIKHEWCMNYLTSLESNLKLTNNPSQVSLHQIEFSNTVFDPLTCHSSLTSIVRLSIAFLFCLTSFRFISSTRSLSFSNCRRVIFSASFNCEFSTFISSECTFISVVSLVIACFCSNLSSLRMTFTFTSPPCFPGSFQGRGRVAIFTSFVSGLFAFISAECNGLIPSSDPPPTMECLHLLTLSKWNKKLSHEKQLFTYTRQGMTTLIIILSSTDR